MFENSRFALKPVKNTKVKKFIIPVILFSSASLHAQDSTRVVELKEIIVSGAQLTPNQKLLNVFRANNAATLEDIMSRLPELSLVRRGSYGMEPSIRSFSGGQVNVLLDGMRIHGACTDKMDPATIYIEPINLDNLQVQTTSTGFMSGSAIGGTINMKVAEPDFANSHQLTGTVSSGYQTAAKSFYEAAKLNYASGKWAFRASGVYRHNQNYRSGGGDIIPFSQFEKVNYSLSAKYQQNQYTYIKADLLADDGWNIGYPALPMDVGYAAARIGSISIHNENRNHLFYKWQAKLYSNVLRHFMDDTHRPFVPMHMDMPGKSKTFGAFSEAEMKISNSQKILLRADASSTFLKASMTMYQPGELPMYMLTWPDNRKNQFGISAAWLIQADSSLKIQLSTRADFINYALASTEAKDQMSVLGYSKMNRNDVLKNFSAMATKSISKKIKTTASITYAERMPTASELYGFYLFNANDGYDYIGNVLLKKETSFQGELSVAYTTSNSNIKIGGFYSRLSNYITGNVNASYSAMTIGAKGVKSFVNIPQASILGAEASAVVKAAQKVDVISTLRYTYARDNEQQPLPLIAPLKNISSVRYHNSAFWMQLESEAAASQKRISTEAGEDATSGYVLLHVRTGYNFNINKNAIELQAGVDNILDKKYHEHLDWGNIARPGRNIYLQVKLSF